MRRPSTWWRSYRTWRQRLARFLRDDRGSDTIQQLMWALFWLGLITVLGGLIWAWANDQVQELIGF